MNKPLYCSVIGLILCANTALATTSIDKLLQQQPVKNCQQSISAIADQVVKSNKHRFHRPESAFSLAQFSALGVIEYRDRNSHLNITTTTNTDGRCESIVTETFVVPHPCITAREEVFKKWQFVGKLNAATLVLIDRGNPETYAYLSNAVDVYICLISTKFFVKHDAVFAPS